MSHIDDVKMRLSDLFLRDCGNLDAQTESLIRDDVRRLLSKYLRLESFSLTFSPDGNDVCLQVKAGGRRV
ncbi:MAG: hypothetical protein K2M95_03805 [Clostridiales bacterium]|nr:hypothetical protein [Clostridiales bacterium]